MIWKISYTNLAVKPAQTNNNTNGEKNGDKGNGDKENVTPGKPAKVVTQKKKVAKPVRDSKVPTKPVRQGIVASVSRRRKTLTNVVTLEAISSGEVVSHSNENWLSRVWQLLVKKEKQNH